MSATILDTSADKKKPVPSSFGDRLKFVIWLSALRLGTWSAKEFARALDKSEAQFPKWAKEDPKPAWPTIKSLATPVGVQAAWLDDPDLPGAQEPELFQDWLAARRSWKAAQAKAPRQEPASNYTRVSSKELPAKRRRKA